MLEKLKQSNLLIIILLLVLISPSLFGLLHNGFPLTDDGNWMVIRFSAFYEALRSGQFPVRFLSRLNNGYGYPVADFLYPLFMYLGTPIHILKINFVDTIKIIFGLSLIFSSIFTFFWLRKFFDNLSSLVGSLTYTLFPYYLFDIYKRGSIGEALAITIIPLILWQIERKSLIWSSIGVALLILSHNTLAFLFLPLIILYIILDAYVSKKRKENLSRNFVSIFFGLLISSFFWIPAIFDLQFTVFNQTKVSDISSYFANLSYFGLSTFIIVFIVLSFFYLKKIKASEHRLTVFFLIVALLAFIFSMSQSQFLWNFLPDKFIQFPFRIVSVSILAISFLSALVVSATNKRYKLITSLVIIILVFISTYNYLFPKSYQYFPDTFYSTNQDTTTVKGEYMPRWVNYSLLNNPNSLVQNLDGDEKINVKESTASKISFSVDLSSKRTIRVDKVYFPGWIATINGAVATIDYKKYGFIDLNLDSGMNYVSVIFSETPVRLFSDILSLLGFLGIVGYYIFLRLNKQKLAK